jgi:hypothetical protein
MSAAFPLGRLLISRQAVVELPSHEMLSALHRHARADWGDVSSEDRAANDRALANGGRLFSVYRTASQARFWIITEWDRSATTVLLPEDY